MDLDAASKLMGILMRNVILTSIAIAVLFVSPAGAAQSYRYGACQAQADEIANSYMASYLEPATDAERAPKGSFVFIGAGQKFIVPLHPANNGDLHLRGVGQLAHWRATVYQEELARCLGIVHLRLNSNTSLNGQLN